VNSSGNLSPSGATRVVAVNSVQWRYICVIDIVGEPVLRSNDLPAGPAGAAVGGESGAGVYARLAPELIRFAVSIVGPSDAEDLVGAAVLKAISAPRWDRIANKRAYLYRVMLNEARSWHRGRRRRLEREHRVIGRDAVEPERSDPSVLAAVRSLTVRQRAVIHLVYWADLPPPEVADLLDTSLRTIERELHAAKARLKDLLS
jgi:RNA polymerase sigma factor (sigma-70 family)